MRAARLLIGMALAATMSSCARNDGESHAAPSESRVALPWFVECAAQRGLTFRHSSSLQQRYDFPEIMGGGVGLFDFDGDGDLDVYFVQSGDLTLPDRSSGNRLFANLGGAQFVEVTEAAHVGDRGYGMGCACGDYDGDGDIDLYVTNVGANVLYRNDGDGSFTDVTAVAGVGDESWSTAAAFVDFDADGRLDLLVVNYVNWSHATEMACYFRERRRDYCNPNNYGAPARDRLYRNLGDGRFEDVTVRCGLDQAFGNGLGVACGDFDGDGRTDLSVANDMLANQLWIQGPDGRFTDRALLMGCAYSSRGEAQSGMGVHALELGDDGALDVFVTHLRGQGHTLFDGRGSGFVDRTARHGLSAPLMKDTGFGVGFADFDNDGALDLYVANGHVVIEEPSVDPADPYAQFNRLLRGVEGGFVEVSPLGGTSPALAATSRGAAFGDLDDDGDIDIVVVNRDAPAHLLLNEVGAGNAWIGFRVLDARGADALGARVQIECEGEVQTRRVEASYSYLASNDPRVHFGLGAGRRVERVHVRWPDGTTTSYSEFDAGRVYELRKR